MGKRDGMGTYFCKATGTKTAGKWSKGKMVTGSFSDTHGNTFNGVFYPSSDQQLEYAGGTWTMASGAQVECAAPPGAAAANTAGKNDLISISLTHGWDRVAVVQANAGL